MSDSLEYLTKFLTSPVFGSPAGGRVKAQAARFARLFILAAAPSVWQLLQTGHVTWAALSALLIPAVETAWRQFKPPPDAPAYQGKH